jgi:hypothetical protein
MTWLQQYKIRDYVRSSVWIVPLAWAIAAALVHRVAWTFDLWARVKDRAAAGMADYQGIGGSPLSYLSDAGKKK